MSEFKQRDSKNDTKSDMSFLKDLPVIDKKNFRIYNDPDYARQKANSNWQFKSLQARVPLVIASEGGDRIYNEPKQQLVLNQLKHIVNENSSRRLHRTPAKKRKTPKD